MGMDDPQQIQFTIDRLARLSAAEAWAQGLNPTQAAVLSYLCRANRFSRSPSHVANYLASTRGTVSQTLKTLVRKGLVTETRNKADRRSIHYDATAAGRALAQSVPSLDAAARSLATGRLAQANETLADILRQALATRGMRSFGLCRTCAHHERRGDGGYCHLLKVNLQPVDVGQICHEHSA